MARAADTRKSTPEPRPVMALIGATDLMVEKVRVASDKAAKDVRKVDPKRLKNLDPKKLRKDGQKLAARAAEQAADVPALALYRSLELAEMALNTYGDFSG